jgi:hypothetical protein
MGWPYDKYLWREDVRRWLRVCCGWASVERWHVPDQPLRAWLLPATTTSSTTRPAHTQPLRHTPTARLQNTPQPQAVPAKKQYAAVAKAISAFEPVTMLTDPSVVDEAKRYLADAPNVTVQVCVHRATHTPECVPCCSTSWLAGCRLQHHTTSPCPSPSDTHTHTPPPSPHTPDRRRCRSTTAGCVTGGPHASRAPTQPRASARSLACTGTTTAVSCAGEGGGGHRHGPAALQGMRCLALRLVAGCQDTLWLRLAAPECPPLCLTPPPPPCRHHTPMQTARPASLLLAAPP